MPTLKVRVIEAKDLNAADADGKSDPYVVLTIESCKIKGAVKKSTLAPRWDETHQLVFSNPTSELKLEVYDKDMIGSDDSLGSVSISLAELRQGVEKDTWVNLAGGDVGENLQTVGMFEAKKMMTGLFGKSKGGASSAVSSGVKTLATGKSTEIKVTNRGQVHIALTALDFNGAAVAPAGGYGAPGYGAPGGYGAPPGYGGYPPPGGAPGYGAPPPGYGGAPGYGAPPGGAPGYGAPPGGAPGYGAPPGGYGAPPGGAPGYGAPPGGAPGYGAPPGGAPGYGAPPPGYGGAPGYGAPPDAAGYGASPSGYGAPPPGYGAPPGGAPGYGAPPGGAPGYGAPPPGGAPGYGAPYGAPPA